MFKIFGCGERGQERQYRLDIEFDNCIQSAKHSVSDLFFLGMVFI
jgi:hypothetical protein